MCIKVGSFYFSSFFSNLTEILVKTVQPYHSVKFIVKELADFCFWDSDEVEQVEGSSDFARHYTIHVTRFCIIYKFLALKKTANCSEIFYYEL